MYPKFQRVNHISFIRRSLRLLVSGCLLVPVGCRSDSSASRQTTNGPSGGEAHARETALGLTATCLHRNLASRSQDVLTECEGAGKDPRVRVRIEWATADGWGWGARATQEGVPGDCVYVSGWPTESRYLFTSRERRGAPFGGWTCDGDTSVAARSWPEFMQASFAWVMERNLRRVHTYQAKHAGAFPPVDSLPSWSDSLVLSRPLWARPEGFALEMSSPALPGLSCLVWDGTLGGRTPPTTAGHRQVAQARVVTCDDFGSATQGKS